MKNSIEKIIVLLAALVFTSISLVGLIGVFSSSFIGWLNTHILYISIIVIIVFGIYGVIELAIFFWSWLIKEVRGNKND
jgi:hypothetical protein